MVLLVLHAELNYDNGNWRSHQWEVAVSGAHNSSGFRVTLILERSA